MNPLSKLLIALTIMVSSITAASPIDDLASPDQTVRDKAAAELRVTFQSTPESKWAPAIGKIKKGQTRKEILELFLPLHITEDGGIGSGQSHSEFFRLDDEWILVCWFENAGEILIDRKLAPSMRNIWTAPSKGYTGRWVVYFVNGQKSHEIRYKDGRYFGEFTSYHSDGSKSVVQHYTEKGADGEDTGYYPSGKVAYRGQYKENKLVGAWTWYDEAGVITSTRQQPEP